MSAARKTYDDDFKRKAIERVDNRGDMPVKEVLAELGVHNSMIKRWRREFSGGKAKTKSKSGSGVRQSPEIMAEAVKRYRGGEDIERIAKAFKVTSGTIYKWASRHDAATAADAKAPVSRGNGHAKPDRTIHSAIALLRQVRGQINVTDPVHLTAMLVLATLEGKM